MLPDIARLRLSDPDGKRIVDRLLRFRSPLDQKYERENADARSADLREVMLVGLALFNIHNITDYFLLDDVYGLAIALRLFVLTPSGLLGVFMIGRIPAKHRERLALFLVTSAYLIEVFLFWKTASPLGNYSFSQLSLTIVYGNMLIQFRFRHAIVFTAISIGFVCLIVLVKSDMLNEVRFAFFVQTAMACAISLYANFKTERRRCIDYVVAHVASTRADQADMAKIELHDQSRTDALTGLPNRRLLDERLKEWFADDQSLAVMMIDIDHFKLFNDSLGHPAGDDCLKAVGRALAELAKTHDVLCARFGGEEFAVIARGANELGAARVANTIVRAIEALQVVHPGRSDGIGVVTASVGVAFKPAGQTACASEVTAEADQALYRAKRNGRNCFMFGDKSVAPRSAQS